MKFDFSVADKFFAFLQGEIKLETVLSNSAYQAVFSHSRLLGTELTFDDVARAVAGKPSMFYGLKNLHNNLPSLKRLLNYIREKEREWLAIIEKTIEFILPKEDHDQITIYPIIGYDAGIGYQNSVCLNLNIDHYLDNPYEFLYLAIHECFHAIYEHLHPFPSITQVSTAEERLSVFNYFLKNEGYAVYAPLKLRLGKNHLGNDSHPILEDYQVLFNKKEITKHVRMYDTLVLNLQEIEYPTIDDYLNEAFGSYRLCYRIGCILVKRIEEELGIDEVRDAVYLSGNEFASRYDYLLRYYR